MKKTREEKAITLVALIITIIVLLILAVVAINAVTGDGIIQHATNAKVEYEKAQKEEEDILTYYSDYLTTNGNAGKWKENSDGTITTKDEEGKEITIPLGATVTYTPEVGKTYTSKKENTGVDIDQTFITTVDDNTWRVLGLENGKILLVSDNIKFLDDSSLYALSNIQGYNNIVKELNNICSIYGTGEGAESSRSINANDIYKMCNITDLKEDSKKNNYFEYGANYTYIYGDSNNDGEKDAIMYKKNDGEYVVVKDSSGNNVISYTFSDGAIINSENEGPKQITTTTATLDLIGREQIGNMVLLDNNDLGYWIANTGIVVYDNAYKEVYIAGDVALDVHVVYDNMYRRLVMYTVQKGNVQSTKNAFGVRPVVVLKADTKIELKEGSTTEYIVKK